MKKQLVIYHGNCIDGFTAAWAAWNHFGDEAEYFTAMHGSSERPNVEGRDVLIVDFCYQRAELLAMKEQAASLLVLDHHKTAIEDCEGLDCCVFDLNRSGAGMTWDHFFGRQLVRSKLVSYVEDRDLWRFALPNSKAVNAYIGACEHTFAAWEELAELLDESQRDVELRGEALLMSQKRYVESMAKEARVGLLAGYPVPIVNAPYIGVSELVGHLAETTNALFAASWYQRADGKYQYSLRSKRGFDVAQLAESFGGGGHAAAAGFSVSSIIHEEFS